ncbi:hypothetical protein HGM15179_013214 [Zosterops borbonicus]|uniref:Uncharacterized protein n=1 Tax=Zosterops borbonicus TaxID=364589 RepID=A0A8K1G8E0_9PASS|nr:hypothetical protein HGM15179_013214 [Zosterops borbonicus]
MGLKLSSLQFPGPSFLALLKIDMTSTSSRQELPLIVMTFQKYVYGQDIGPNRFSDCSLESSWSSPLMHFRKEEEEEISLQKSVIFPSKALLIYSGEAETVTPSCGVDDSPEGWDAIQRDLDKLERTAEKNKTITYHTIVFLKGIVALDLTALYMVGLNVQTRLERNGYPQDIALFSRLKSRILVELIFYSSEVTSTTPAVTVITAAIVIIIIIITIIINITIITFRKINQGNEAIEIQSART